MTKQVELKLRQLIRESIKRQLKEGEDKEEVTPVTSRRSTRQVVAKRKLREEDEIDTNDSSLEELIRKSVRKHLTANKVAAKRKLQEEDDSETEETLSTMIKRIVKQSIAQQNKKR